MTLYDAYGEWMSSRPRASLGRILHDLGSTVLDVAAAPGELDAEVTGVHIYDPLDELLVPPGGIVLAVGIHRAEDIQSLLKSAGRAAGIVVKVPVDVDERVRAAVAETGVAVLGLTRAASWAQIAALLRSLLAEGDLAEPGEEPHGDLFALANALCALLDAPVTIEDRSSRVLAYSGRQDEANAGRIETVLGRQVPERYQRMLDERGLIKELYQSRAPVYMELPGDLHQQDRHRGAVGRRDPRLHLGRRPRTADRAAAPRARRRRQGRRAAPAARAGRGGHPAAAARRPAVHRARRRLGRGRGGGPARRRHAAAVRAGGPADRPARGRPGTRGERSAALLRRARPARGHHPPQGGRRARRLRRLRHAPLTSGLPLTSGDGGTDEEARAVRIAQDFLARVGPRHPANIGVGRLADSLGQVARSRADADRALRVLRARGASGEAAGYTTVHFESLLLQVADVASAEEQTPTGPYQRLLAHDREHGSELVTTLRAYLDAFGDVNLASARVHVPRQHLPLPAQAARRDQRAGPGRL